MDVISPHSTLEPLSLLPITNRLHLPILLFQLPLNFKVRLPFPLDALVVHIANDSLVHERFVPLLLEMHEDDDADCADGCSSQREFCFGRH